MKITILSIVLVMMVTCSLKAQHTLTIEISNLKSKTGFIIVDFRDGENNFIKGISQEIKNNKCIIKVDNLKAGKYSFKYFLDENKNNELDTYWIGAPKEGYGFSNNVKGKFGPPAFKDTVFELRQDTTVYCTLIYINL